jgi:hypothetical protein
MSRRRLCDPLADARLPHWLTVSDPHRNLLTCQVIPIGADLRKLMRKTLTQWAAQGWQSESDGAFGFVFIARGAERRLVNVTPADPAGFAGQNYASPGG